MLEKLKYISSRKEEIAFGENGIFVNYNDLRDYDWSFEAVNNKISSFTKGITEKTLPVIIKAGSEEEGLRIKNELFEIAEKDLLTHSHGKIVIGDYYLKCFIKGSKKSNYLIDKGYLETELKIVTDFPMWTKETTTPFKVGSVATSRKNIFGGIILAQALVNSGSSNVVLDTDAKVVKYGYNTNYEDTERTRLYSGFKENTQYTIILEGTHDDSESHYGKTHSVHLSLVYSNNGIKNIQLAETGEFSMVIHSDENRTLKYVTYNQNGDYGDKIVLKYERCGVFEGAITADEFEPYKFMNKDYPHGYSYDYANGAQNTMLLNEGIADADFEITIYGACVNPMIVIGGHAYSVDTEILTGEYLKINSKEKKVYKVKYDGEVVNQFDFRNREYYIFKKISAGANNVAWSGMFGFDVTLLEERSEPKWT